MGSERGHVPCEHHGAFSYFFCGGHLRIAVGGPNVSCRDGSGGRAARGWPVGHSVCNTTNDPHVPDLLAHPYP
jgi:hypothetical protein